MNSIGLFYEKNLIILSIILAFVTFASCGNNGILVK